LLSLIQSLPFVCLRRIRPGAELDDELAIEGRGDTCQGVDPGRPRPSLDSRDRRLRGSAELGQLALGKPPGVPPLRDAFGDQAEQLSILRT